jgi:hypothetical protein
MEERLGVRLGVKKEAGKAEILMNAHLPYFQSDLQQATELGLK